MADHLSRFLTGADVLSRLGSGGIRRMAMIYITVFAQTSSSEGAVHPDGRSITLSEYFHLVYPDRSPAYNNSGVMSLLDEFENLQPVDRKNMEIGIKESSGFGRVYDLDGVAKRFQKDLTSGKEITPTVFLWGEEPFEGFGVAYVIRTQKVLEKIIVSMPYLEPWVAHSVINFLSGLGLLKFPLELDSETAALDSARGSQHGGWRDGLSKLRRFSLAEGCQTAIAITSPESQTYKGLLKKPSTHDSRLSITASTGQEMMLMITDVSKSVEELSN